MNKANFHTQNKQIRQAILTQRARIGIGERNHFFYKTALDKPDYNN